MMQKGGAYNRASTVHALPHIYIILPCMVPLTYVDRLCLHTRTGEQDQSMITK